MRKPVLDICERESVDTVLPFCASEVLVCAFSRASGITSLDRWTSAGAPVKMGERLVADLFTLDAATGARLRAILFD